MFDRRPSPRPERRQRWPFRRRAVQVLALLCLLAGVLAGLAPAGYGAEVTYLERPVQVRRAGQTDWQPLALGDAVDAGDAIRTGRRGRCEVTIAPGRMFRVGPATVIQLDDLLAHRDSLRTRLRVLAGRLWNSLLRPLDPGTDEYNVSTTTATLGVKGTRFDVSYDAERKALEALVLEGAVEAQQARAEPPGPPTEISGPLEIAPPEEISREEWTLLVSANQKLAFVEGADPTVVPITAADRDDEWVRFNESRDAALR